MTIEFKTGNILDCKETMLIQSVNYRKVMGAGLAKQIKNKYPKIFDQYCKFIDSHSWFYISQTGLFDMFKINDNPEQFICNVFGQKDFGNDKCYTDYESLKNGLSSVELSARLDKRSVALPFRIGAGLSGGDWNIVYKIIQDIFENSEVKVVIYKLKGIE